MTLTVSSPSSPLARGEGWGLHLKITDAKWWIWASLAALLVAGFAGYDTARYAAMVIAACQAVAWLALHRSIRHFPTQVRTAYAVWMALSFMPLLAPMFWIQAAGTTLLVLFGYCPLARMLLFMPFNRKVPLTMKRAIRIIVHPPTSGSVLCDLQL